LLVPDQVNAINRKVNKHTTNERNSHEISKMHSLIF